MKPYSSELFRDAVPAMSFPMIGMCASNFIWPTKLLSRFENELECNLQV